jgi:hypothetical protein
MQPVRSLFRSCSVITIGSLFAGSALAQDAERPTLRAGRIDGAGNGPVQQAAAPAPRHTISLDGRLSEPVWATVDSISNLVTVEPEEGGTPEGRTVVKVLVSPDAIIIGARCYDKDPKGVVSFSRARDSELEEEDHLIVLLDTFQDERSGYVFGVNPSGARLDGIVIEGGDDINPNWDAVWEARTSRDAEGWSAEIRIPVKSLSFKKGLTSWGFNVQRRVQRLQETSRWSGAKQDYELYQSSRSGLLTELAAFDLGVGLTIRPAVISDSRRPVADQSMTYTGDVSLDVTQRLGPNLNASLTYNTDFAETEVDARQTNLTRFDIEFPEKRAFFLEGSDIFQFGLGLDEASLVPFFSRRIGLLRPETGESEKIPIHGGFKLNGRAGNTNLGALVMRTGSVTVAGEEQPMLVREATMGAVRISQNVLDESSIGMIYTFGDPLGLKNSWLAGADATYRTSELFGDKNFVVGAWGLRNNRQGYEGGRDAYGMRIDYPNDLLGIAATAMEIGEGVQPSLGFAPRTGVRVFESGLDYNPRPERWGIRQMFHELGVIVFTDLENKWETYEAKVNPLDWQLESGDRVNFKILPQGDRPPEGFDVFDNENEAEKVAIPAGSYEWTRYAVTGTLAQKRRIGGEVTYEFGRFYNGDLKTLIGAVVLKPVPALAVELSGERNRGTLQRSIGTDEDGEEVVYGGSFTQYLYGTRVEIRPSPDFQVSSFVQYDNESRSLGTNTRLRWTFHPLGDLFATYNHNLHRSLAPRQRFALESNQFIVKLQYALQM